MSSTPYDSNQDDEDAEHLVTTDEGEGASETIKDLPLDNDINEVDDLEDDDDDYQSSKKSSRNSSRKSSKKQDDEDDATTEGSESEYIEYLKKPPLPTIDDLLEEAEEDLALEAAKEIDVLTIQNLTRDEATNIALDVIGVLEEDLADYVERTGTVFPKPLSHEEKKRIRIGLGAGDSASSFNSDMSDYLPGEPSKIKMTYDKGVSVYANLSILQLNHDEMVDAECQVNLHRIKHGDKRLTESFSQTLEMVFLPADQALLIFKQLYPQMDDFKVKEPPTRQASQEFAMKLALETEPDIDFKRKGPEIISLSNKKQLLQPLMDNYFKDEMLWTGGRFLGEYVGRQFFKGKYEHPTGATIESEFRDGHFESDKHLGLVSYPRGYTFEGQWKEGRYQTGQITFCDGLKFSSTDWKYCEPPDRRFKVERYYGMRPAGKTLFSDQFPPPRVPPGMYDVGDGYYNPKNGDVRRYDGFLQRRATASERYWIEQNCRKVHTSMEQCAPKFLPERIPGSYCDSMRRIPLTKKRYH